ncbi:26S proteasome non-ATPase regulatory subunit 4 [Perkinsus olseni]|uniref:26S proteasome non-ATPase regulatory subunit 4 n=1 Tax=Perkinsus olseni TaxID=32597 RepID=A0A7J6SYW6_PEROL|nr:26S proteasome non-ATPase regulatory subunit 4 [Perkinsus olseni]
MSVEAVMLCLDTSEWCRNADYVPDRIQAETEAANLICGAKSQQHPETAVGVLTMTGSSDGSGVDLRQTPTTNLGEMLTALSNLSPEVKDFGPNGPRSADLVVSWVQPQLSVVENLLNGRRFCRCLLTRKILWNLDRISGPGDTDGAASVEAQTK